MRQCTNCGSDYYFPGKVVRTSRDGICVKCGDKVTPAALIPPPLVSDKWHVYFHAVCAAVASKSPCLSHKIGAILVRDHSIIATGYNGPARGYPHCNGTTCPRRLKGYKSGEGLLECPAAHAEGNCIANAARMGVITMGSTLLLNFKIPCKDCMVDLVNAGIVEVVVDDPTPYHEISLEIAKYGKIKIRRFQL